MTDEQNLRKAISEVLDAGFLIKAINGSKILRMPYGTTDGYLVTDDQEKSTAIFNENEAVGNFLNHSAEAK